MQQSIQQLQVMESDTIQKNEASPKSRASRTNFLVRTIPIIGLVVLILSSCSTAKIFNSPDSRVLATNHQTVAIIPSTVSITARRNISAEAMQEQQRTESLNFQKEIYSWMLNRKMRGKLTVEIQEIETTNALLTRAGYPETPLTNAEICELLGVDGIILSNFVLAKPMSEAAAVVTGVATAVLTGTFVSGSTNTVQVKLNISDCKNKKLIWSYEDKLSRGLGSSPATMVDQMMRHASKNMPYVR